MALTSNFSSNVPIFIMDEDVETVRFRLDPEKVLLFSKVDEKRIPCELK